MIFYGLVGCASGILFFNLFLERVITFLASLIRELYARKIITRADDEELPENWKPGVYSVLACLLFTSALLVCSAVPVYSILEGWTYVESAYFCFVSFSTIGFGDFVAAENTESKYTTLYVLVNVAVIGMGCCLLYSLFNVISIVLKQFLYWLIHRLNAITAFLRRKHDRQQPDRVIRKYSLKMQRERRIQHKRTSVANARKMLKRKKISAITPDTERTVTDNRLNGTSSVDRKPSDDGLTSMKDFLTSNQVSLALMQKQLQESAQIAAGPTGPSDSNNIPVSCTSTSSTAPVPALAKASFPVGRFIPGTIGPLAMLCDKLGDK